ncbi:aldehyde dehydrogenase [Lentibacillus kapialis]|uniref:Aldehyde dehydrogenase n=1 Tax=Lentibacillus kapialis TaxID=340214 RepID=A0A917Q0G1_9BACI|nr:aldehyde dehydrogenase [Lentibacillus kapialis]GGK03440.1 aldehyde dehydrogenase [Lentibacillus kapialis]
MKQYKMFINGEWISSANNQFIESLNPYNREIWATIPEAGKQDVEKAIEAANYSFHNGWKQTSGYKRARKMNKLASLIEKNADKLAEIETKDNGKVTRETYKQMFFAARAYRFFAGYADKIGGETIPLDNTEMFDYTVREPIGVAVLITSWNSPIQLLTNKLAPALAAGNSVIIKPSEHASASTLEIMKLIEQSDFPKGVVNCVTGGGEIGELLTQSSNVSKISFTGGLNAARYIGKNAAENFVPLTLELGGKSPNIIFEDADLEKAVPGAMAGIFASSGQTCIAGSRLFLHESIVDQVSKELKVKSENIVLGDPTDKKTEMGPIANETQYNSIKAMLKETEDEGAKILTGGLAERKSKGLFIHPTIIVDSNNSMKVAQNEIFGPILTIIPFKDEKEVVQLANDSIYGLASGIWTQNLARAHRVAKQIEAGTVWINTYRASAVQAPFGGMKHSGYGKERGLHALLDYTKVKNVMIDLSEDVRDPFSIKI